MTYRHKDGLLELVNGLTAEGDTIDIGKRMQWENVGDILPILIRENRDFNIAAEHFGTSRARMSLRRARGTIAAPEPPLQNDILGSYQGWGHTGATMEIGGELDFRAAADWSDTDHGTNVRLQLKPPGGTALESVLEVGHGTAAEETALLIRHDGTVRRVRVKSGDTLTATDDVLVVE